MDAKDKKKSDVWAYFEQPVKKNDKMYTKCLLCCNEFAYHGGTSSMRNHLNHRHPSKSKQATNGQVGALAGRQHTLTSMKAWNRSPMTSAVQEKHTRNLALLCALDARPLSLCEGVGFKNFVKGLNPDYKIPTRPTVTRYLHKIYEEAKVDVVKALSGQHVAMTSDIWTSNSLDGYLSVTGHFIDSTWKLQNKNLSTKPFNDRHTGVNIARAILQVATEFQVESIPCLLTDNATNMTVAAREAEIDHAGVYIYPLKFVI